LAASTPLNGKAFGVPRLFAMLRILRRIVVGLLSGALFWLPSILVHAIAGVSFDAFHILVVNVFAIVATALTVRRLVQSNNFPWSAQAFLALHVMGVWILGPACVLASASAGGGGALQEDLARFLDARILLFPPVTFIGATYEGSLGALVLVTVAVPIWLLAGVFTWWERRVRPTG
jgi:hypothetical protein